MSMGEPWTVTDSRTTRDPGGNGTTAGGRYTNTSAAVHNKGPKLWWHTWRLRRVELETNATNTRESALQLRVLTNAVFKCRNDIRARHF